MSETKENKNKGNVLVVGGGVAGLNAALDLAAQGYHVDLVEKESELGGTVAKLHRLYPLCSCCKAASRATLCQLHPNIRTWTQSSVARISGNAGAFQAVIAGPAGETPIEAQSVILALGVEPFNPQAYDTYAYAAFENVISSIELEWLQKPVGPFQGVPKRPSDGQVPKKVAWLQCVGSREINKCDAPYCSSVCCMYALKEAVHLKDTVPDAETTIFFMDMRTHGKGYERYFEDAKQKGVRLVRSRIHSIEKAAGTEDLVLEYVDENGTKQVETFDLVVLSVGLRPSPELEGLAKMLGVTLTEDHYVASESFKPCETNVPGVFVCGGAAGPRDVHQSVVEAAAAAGKAAAWMKGTSGNGAAPEFRDVRTEAPAVGVVLSLCPSKLPEFEALLDPLANFVKGLPGVTFVERLDLRDSSSLARLTDRIKTGGINRLVYASCTPIVHRELIEGAMQEAGLNPTLYEFVDLRTLGSTPVEMTRLQSLFRAAVLKARMLEPLPYVKVPVKKSALVVGGGLAGMQAALAFAEMGVPVTLVEKKEQLGGHAHKVKSSWKGESVQELLKATIAKVTQEPQITVLTSAEVVGARGFAGNYISTVLQGGQKKEVEHGVVVLATGAHSLKPQEYAYGQHPQIYRWSDFTKKFMAEPEAFRSARCGVFIQCVGSREPERPYCSRLCCSFAVRSAIDLKALNPDMDVYVLYREVRTFGERERIYKEAREKGVFFIRYDLDSKPQVSLDGGQLKVVVTDPILGRSIALSPDFISLQTAILPPEVGDLAGYYKVSLNEDGFLSESPAKMRPVDGETDGVFFAGLALAPKGVEESLAEGWAAAARAMRLLSRDVMLVGGAVAEVDPDKCAVCLTCVRTCPFHIPYIDSPQGHAFIDPGLCQGCGMCVSECPGKAISFRRLSDDHIAVMARDLLGSAVS